MRTSQSERADCVNVDINQEATAYLMHTGHLSHHMASLGQRAHSGPGADITAALPAYSSHLESFTLSPNVHAPAGRTQCGASIPALDSPSRSIGPSSPTNGAGKLEPYVQSC